MADTTPFTIGADVTCTDGPCGKLTKVVVDPVERAVTHLVVEPHHGHEPPRLVPVDLVDTMAGELRLRCTVAEFGVLNPAEQSQFIQGAISYPQYGPEQAVFWPYYGNRGSRGDVVTTDAIPEGELEVRRHEHVHATDGEIGKVEGLVIDSASHRVTHVLLQEGHLWGHKEVAIPISAVTGAEDGIQVSMTKAQVADLPPVDIDHPGE
jgi:sporulation protein YlmC with PRC-barrel domain